MNISGLVFFAMPDEARPFQARASEVLGVRIVVTGMGRHHAIEACQAALASHQPKWVITSGFAGGLDPSLHTGDVVFDADPSFPQCSALSRMARPTKFLCVDQILTTARAKADARSSTDAGAVDMESEYIRTLSAKRGIPSATIRVISDTAQEDMPLDFNALMTADHRLNIFKLATSIVRRPSTIPALWRFGQQTRRCAKNLAHCLMEVVRELSKAHRL